MPKKEGFTLIELLVVIAIIAVLMSILMPALQRVKLQAQDAIDKSNQHQFALIWKFWTDENDGRFPPRGGGASWGEVNMGAWPFVLYDYMPSIDPEIYLCPAATKPRDEGGRCPYAAWVHSDTDDDGNRYRTVGSYTCNYWVASQSDDDDEDQLGKFWGTPSVRGAGRIPLLMCANWKDSEPEPTDEPPPSKEWIERECWEANRNEMKRVCHHRHGRFVNTNMLDLSARAVGLKELWILRWHRQWPGGCDHMPNPWPLWMADLPDPCID